MSDFDRVEEAAQRFMAVVSETLGHAHPLPRIFSGLMMVYCVDEPSLRWVDIAMRPWFADAEKISERQEAEIVFAVLWLSTAARARRAVNPL